MNQNIWMLSLGLIRWLLITQVFLSGFLLILAGWARWREGGRYDRAILATVFWVKTLIIIGLISLNSPPMWLAWIISSTFLAEDIGLFSGAAIWMRGQRIN